MCVDDVGGLQDGGCRLRGYRPLTGQQDGLRPRHGLPGCKYTLTLPNPIGTVQRDFRPQDFSSFDHSQSKFE